jgi:hypothetical protein
METIMEFENLTIRASSATSVSSCLRLLLTCALVFAGAVPARAQLGKWSVDQKTSLAWWQVVPHFYHLFGTTCPQDPSWIPGDARDGGSPWQFDARSIDLSRKEIWDTARVPLFPRGRVRAVCSEAVVGEFDVPDTVTWRGIHGSIVIQAKALASGQAMRDKFMEGMILESDQYPEIKFNLDSVVDVSRTAKGDTLRGRAFGTFTAHGVNKPLAGRFMVWRDAAVPGTIRVSSKFHFPAGDLVSDFHMSKWSLGLGVQSGIWRDLWEGVDLILKPTTTTSSAQ